MTKNQESWMDAIEFAEEQARLGTTLKDTDYKLSVDENDTITWDSKEKNVVIEATPHYQGCQNMPVTIYTELEDGKITNVKIAVDFVWSPTKTDESNWSRYEQAVYNLIKMMRSI